MNRFFNCCLKPSYFFTQFKKIAIRGFVEHDPESLHFDSIFHSFFKYIPVSELFKSLSRSNRYAEQQVSIPDTYAINLLSQDFSHQDIEEGDFLRIVEFPVNTSPNNYLRMKEGLYSFIKNHIGKIHNQFSEEDQFHNFDKELFKRIACNVRPSDMGQFSEFFPTLLNSVNDADMVCENEKSYTFDINYGYLSRVYPRIITKDDAKETVTYIKNVINEHLTGYLSCDDISITDKVATFCVVFKNNIEKKNIPEIFSLVINIMLETNMLENKQLAIDDYDADKRLKSLLPKQLDVMALGNILPPSGRKNSKHKL